ncbi:MAG: cell division protein FtsQ/DivIB [Alphaproteobacteria bacterium]
MARKKAKKTSNMTSRQRQTQQIMREKNARKKRAELMRKVRMGGAAAAVVVAGVTGFFIWKHSLISHAYTTITNGMYQLTADAGFGFEVLYLEGRYRTPTEEIRKVIGLKKGDPILQVSLEDLRQRLEGISSIHTAYVERELPGRLNVKILERQPVAIWQYQGNYTLIDDNGVSMPDIKVAEYPHLPLVVGKNAPASVGEVLQLLQAEKELAPRFKAAVRISSRRWNIRMDDNTEVKLPEKDPQAAWARLAQMHEKQALLDRDLQAIDLRVNGRMFITLPVEAEPVKLDVAKET